MSDSQKLSHFQRRDVSISIARCMAMLMILSCHMFSYYKLELALWLNVGVQVFFVISGFLYGTKDLSSPIEFIKRSFNKILVPYWLFLVIAIAAYYLFCPQELSMISIIRAFSCSGTIKGLGHLWFVGYILFCYFLTPYLFWLRKYTEKQTTKKVIYTYSFLFILIQLVGFLFNSFFDPDRVSCYVVGFFLADLFRRLSLNQSICLKWLLFFVALFMNVGEIYIKYISNVEFMGWQTVVFKALCRYSHMFLGIAIFILFYGHFKFMRYNDLLRYSDKYSYPVYLVHQLFILSPLSLMAITSVNLINWMLVLVASLCSGILLLKIGSKLSTSF